VLPQARKILRQTKGGKSTGQDAQMTGSVRPGRPDVFNMSRQTSFDEAGFKRAERRSLVAQMLQRSGRGNSSLFRTGLLSTAAPNPGDFTSSRLVSSITPGKDPSVDWADGALPAGKASKAVKAARNNLGISEVGTSNRGEKIDKWSRRYGMVGQPWCGIFVGTVLRKAGVRTDSRLQAGRQGCPAGRSAHHPQGPARRVHRARRQGRHDPHDRGQRVRPGPTRQLPARHRLRLRPCPLPGLGF
jgi:hypothetical protein